MPLKHPPSHGMDRAAQTARARVDVESRNNSGFSDLELHYPLCFFGKCKTANYIRNTELL